jgi:hypothetical protein
VRSGAALDPAEGSPHGDLARAEVRYDDVAGSVELVADLHAAPEPDADPPAVLWQLAGPRSGAQCDASQGSGGAEVSFEPGEAIVRYQRGEEEEIRVPARVVLEQNGLRARVTASDPRLAGLAISCASLFASSGDDVAPFDLTVTSQAAPPGTATPGPGAGSGPGTATLDLYRFRRRVLSTRRPRRHRAELTVRALVCGPPARIRVRIRYGVRRRGGRGFTPARTVDVIRDHKRRCQQHRFTWPIRTATNGRYDVRAALSAARTPMPT